MLTDALADWLALTDAEADSLELTDALVDWLVDTDAEAD